MKVADWSEHVEAVGWAMVSHAVGHPLDLKARKTGTVVFQSGYTFPELRLLSSTERLILCVR